VRALILALVMLVSGLAACPEDKQPDGFEVGDLLDLGESEVVDETDEPPPPLCNDHEDCDEDELCFRGDCLAREDALDDCEEDDDCPVDFVCVETVCEEE
jgi:hypothetical protein